ncbi:MAG: GNAT family N-acetyltransferase [Acidimicrobiales bacterium]
MDDQIIISDGQPDEVLAGVHEAALAEQEYVFAARDPEAGDRVLVARQGDEALGYIVTSTQGDRILVWEHVVVPSRRGEGIGQSLMLEVARRADPKATIEIDPLAELDLARLNDYYRQLGFETSTSSASLGGGADQVFRIIGQRLKSMTKHR